MNTGSTAHRPTPGGSRRRGLALRSARFAALALAALAASLAALAPAASADTQVCTPGAGSGHCQSPQGLATDFETGLLYVADKGNNRIDVFEEEGKKAATPASFGGVSAPEWIAVDNVATSPSHHDLYVTQGYGVKKFESDGTLADEFGEQGDGTPEGCQLERENDPVAVGPNGDVYLADSYDKDGAGPGHRFANRVVKFDAAGNCIGAVALFEGQEQRIWDLAVDSVGEIYVTVGGGGSFIHEYSPVGALFHEFELESRGLAVDAEDHLFAEQRGERKTKNGLDQFLTEYDSAAEGGGVLRRWAYSSSYGLGGSNHSLAALHASSGDLFVGDSASGVLYSKFPPPGPVLFPEPCKVKNNAPGAVRAVLQAEVNPEGRETKYEFQYEALGEPGNPFEHAQSAGEVTLEEAGAPAEDFELHEAAQTVEPLEPETEYRCRVLAKNADSTGEGTLGEEGSFKTAEPFSFGAAWTAEVTQTSALLNAEGDPNGAPSTAQIEYVTDAQYEASGFAEAKAAPTPPLDYGAGEGSMVLRSASLTGLSPGTLYHYRLRAFQPLYPEGLICPEAQTSCPSLEHTFRTYGPEEVPDNRGYELVSPAQKNSAEVVGTANGRGFVEANSVLIQAGATNGEAVTYTSWISFGEAQGAPATSQYLSRRNQAAERWETDNVSPFGFQSSIFVPPYLGFTPELSEGVVKAGEPSLAAGCPGSTENLYAYEAATRSLRCLTTEAPTEAPGKFGYFFIYGGASEDGSRVFFKARGARYAGVPAGCSTCYSLYEAHEGQLHPVSVLPGETEPAVPTEQTTFGMKTREGAQAGQSVLHNAISADGSKAIWTYVPSKETEPSRLLDRIEGSETVQLDALQSGKGKAGEGVFWAASKDGQVVYFTSENRLINGSRAATGAPDLYRYDFEKPPGERLTDLNTAGEAQNVQGVLGASEDGSVLYFVAKAALTPPSEENQAAQHAEAGKYNLYLYDAEEAKTRFIARLSGEDVLDWESQPKSITARVSPDGQHLAFLSTGAKELAGFDNTLAASKGKFAGTGKCQIDEFDVLHGTTACPEAFLYSKQSASFACASCNPAGSRPLGPALLPGWSSMSEGPRYLSADGKRFFFETYDRLLPADQNNLRDVYEWEAPGSGTCTESSPSYDPVSGGCHFLVSNGKSSDESYLIDASASGRDVFFSTRSALTGWDTNENYDVYDYREGGGFAEPAPPAEPCGGEAGCKPPASAAPATQAPATPTFDGPGNAKQKQKHNRRKKHRRKRHARHHHKRKKQRHKHKHKQPKHRRSHR